MGLVNFLFSNACNFKVCVPLIISKLVISKIVTLTIRKLKNLTRSNSKEYCHSFSGSRYSNLRDDGLEPRWQDHPGRVRHLLHHTGGRQAIFDGIFPFSFLLTFFSNLFFLFKKWDSLVQAKFFFLWSFFCCCAHCVWST